MRRTVSFPSVRLSPIKYRLSDPAQGCGADRADRAYYVPIPFEASEKAMNRSYCANGIVNLLFVGKYRPYKNIPVLLSTLERVVNRDNWHAVIVGQAASEEEIRYKQAVMERINRTGMEGRITLLENYSYSKMRDLYLASDVLILPSRNESHGMAIVEAMAHGLMVICTDTCGAAFCNLEAGGIIVKQDDVDSLQEAIECCLDTPSVIEKKGTNSYMYVQNNLSFDKYYEALSSLLRCEYRIS